MSQYVIERGNSAWPTTDNEWELIYNRLAKPGANRLIYFMHGAGGYGQVFSERSAEFPAIDVTMRATMRMLADNGYVILSTKHGGANTWGNDLSLGMIEDWVDYMFTTHPMTQGGSKLALLGISMGHITAFNYAVRHTSQVVGGICAVPAVSLEYHYHGGVEGNVLLNGWVPNAINTAYGLSAGPPDGNNAPTLNATVKAERDPVTRAAELNGVVPWHLFYNSDDPVTDTGNQAPPFVAASGASYTAGTGGHFEWEVDNAFVLSFINGLNWS